MDKIGVQNYGQLQADAADDAEGHDWRSCGLVRHTIPVAKIGCAFGEQISLGRFALAIQTAERRRAVSRSNREGSRCAGSRTKLRTQPAATNRMPRLDGQRRCQAVAG